MTLQTRAQQIDADVIDAYRHVVPRDGAYVELCRVRKYLAQAGVTKDDSDASFARLYAAGYARFLPMKREFVGRKDKRAAVKVGRTACHLVAIGG